MVVTPRGYASPRGHPGLPFMTLLHRERKGGRRGRPVGETGEREDC